MKALSGIEIHYVVEELQTLVGARIDNIYQLAERDFLFQFFTSGKGKTTLRIVLPRLIYIAQERPPAPQTPYGFCQYLRKHFENARIMKVSQAPGERIIEITTACGEETKSIILEFFRKGNLLVIDQQRMVQNALERQPKETYHLPTSGEPLEQKNLAAINESLSALGLVAYLARHAGLGGNYAEELCLISGIDKHTKNITSEQLNVIITTHQTLLHSPKRGYTYSNPSDIIDATCLPLHKYESYTATEHASFSEALEQYHLHEKVILPPTRKEKETQRFLKIIEKQEDNITTWNEEIAQNQAKGNLIYERYQEIQHVLAEFLRIRKEIPLSKLQEKITKKSVIQEIHPSKKTIVVETANL